MSSPLHERLAAFLASATADNIDDDTPLLDIIGYPLTFGDLRALTDPYEWCVMTLPGGGSIYETGGPSEREARAELERMRAKYGDKAYLHRRPRWWTSGGYSDWKQVRDEPAA